jgi:hypothetical protein
MKSMTIRGIDPALEHALKAAADERNSSVNQLVLDTLRQRFGLEKPPRYSRRHHDLDELFGCWSEEDFERIQAATEEQRKIDPELWP